MITTAAKFWLAVAALAFVGIFLYGFPAGGEWFGSVVLASIFVATLALGVLAVALRDNADDTDGAAAEEVQVRHSLPAPWPAVGALGAGVAAIGLAGKNALLYVGLGILAITFAEWLVQGWAERATADRRYNQTLRDRIMSPIEIPILALLVIGFVLVSLSRVLLAVSDDASTAIAIAVAVAILAVGTLVATRPRLGGSVRAAVLALGAVVLVVGGIAGGVAGHREFEHHGGEEKADTPTTGGEEGNNAVEDQGGEDISDPGADPSGAPTDGKSSDTGGDSGDKAGSEQENENSTPASMP